MLSRKIESLKYLLSEYRFYFLSITLLLALLVYTRCKILIAEEELVRINKELLEHQVTFEKRQKEYDEKAKQQREKLERMIKEINKEINSKK